MKKLVKSSISMMLVLVLTLAMGVVAFAADPVYSVVGQKELTGADWDIAGSAGDMTKDGDVWVKEYKGIEPGEYIFKVATDHAWNNGEYGFDGAIDAGGENAKITLKEKSDVKLTFDGEKVTAEITPVAAASTSTSEDDTAAATETDVNGNDTVKTGDVTPIAAMMAVAVCAGCVAVVSFKKRQTA